MPAQQGGEARFCAGLKSIEHPQAMPAEPLPLKNYASLSASLSAST
jgi:hypothetical protein